MPQRLTLNIYNSAGELVRRLFEGGAQFRPGGIGVDREVLAGGALTILLPGFLYSPGGGVQSGLQWAGDNDAGQAVAGGVYTLRAELTDNFGQLTTLVKAVQVLPAATAHGVRIFNSAGELVANLGLPASPSGRAYRSLAVKDGVFSPEYDPATGAVSAAMRFELRDESGALSWVDWDGRNALGLPAASGAYTASLYYTGAGAGGVVENRPFVLLQAPAADPLSGAVAGPNPLPAGKRLQVKLPLPLPSAVRAELFNLAGERVAGATADPGTVLLYLQTESLAGGLYFVRLSMGNSPHRVLKVALLQ
jgi:hypothetical protein